MLSREGAMPEPMRTDEPSRQLVDDRIPERERQLIPTLEYAFAPLHKAAFGTATGVAGALFMWVLTAYAIVSPRANTFPLGLLAQYFSGYSVTWGGTIVGAVWGFSISFVAGWFVAFCRNLALAIVVFTYRTRAELTETREFLDHI